MFRTFLCFASFFGLTAVGLGAYASHGLTHILPSVQIDAVKLAIQYQFIHALALIAVAILQQNRPNTALIIAGWAFIIGTILFCGTVYSVHLMGLANAKTAPIGGFSMMFGWLCLGLSSCFSVQKTSSAS